MAGLSPNNVIRVPCTLDNIFRYWLEFLTPCHHFTNKEEEVAAAFLKERYRLRKLILDDGLLDKTLMSEDSQRKIREECDLSNPHFQVIKSKLKGKSFFIKDRQINPKLIPNIKEDVDSNGVKRFQLLLLFEIK